MLTENCVKTRLRVPLLVLFLLCALATSTVANASVKVAFLADQGTYANAIAVLQMIKNEDVDLILIQGDLAYETREGKNAVKWEQNLRDTFGKDFPVLSVVGNHDDEEWSDYKVYIKKRIDRASGLDCSGEPGEKALCNFRNIDIVQVAPGIDGIGRSESNTDYARFIDQSFSSATNNWRICSWHMNQRRMQTGDKQDATGWEVFDSCLDAGALVVMGHEHAYSRTYLLSDFENQRVVHKRDDMTLKSGQSVAVVSGLGGWEVRSKKRGGDWFASIYTKETEEDNNNKHGALFCDIETSKAECFFQSIDGRVPDRFTLRRGQDNPSEPPQPSEGYVFSRTDKSELRWIAKADNGRLGSTWIDSACAERLGGVKARGNWRELNELAPELDGVANPCDGNSDNDSPGDTNSGSGFVFARTDRPEFRWVDAYRNDTLGSIWIDPDCVEQLGGVKMEGNWKDLNELAPALDAISAPSCN